MVANELRENILETDQQIYFILLITNLFLYGFDFINISFIN